MAAEDCSAHYDTHKACLAVAIDLYLCKIRSYAKESSEHTSCQKAEGLLGPVSGVHSPRQRLHFPAGDAVIQVLVGLPHLKTPLYDETLQG